MLDSSRACKRSTGHTPDEWEAQRPDIIRWHREERKYEQIVVLLGEVDFVVSKASLQARITKWGLDKKLKESEVIAAAYKIVENRKLGQSTTVSIRGRNVDEDRLIQYCRRKKVTLENLAARYSPATRAADSNCSPSRQPTDLLDLCCIEPPDVHRIPEQLFLYIDRLFKKECNPSRLTARAPRANDIFWSSTQKDMKVYTSTCTIPLHLFDAITSLELRDNSQAMPYIHSAMDFVWPALREHSPFLFPFVVGSALKVFNLGCNNIARLIVEQLRDMAGILDVAHTDLLPHTLTKWLEAMQLDDFRAIGKVAMSLYMSALQRTLCFLEDSNMIPSGSFQRLPNHSEPFHIHVSWEMCGSARDPLLEFERNPHCVS